MPAPLEVAVSTDGGQTWTSWDATPQSGTIASNAGPAWFDVAPDGSLGLDYYLQTSDGVWHIEAGTSAGWMQPSCSHRSTPQSR